MKVVHVIVGLGQGGAEGALVRLIQSSDSPSNHVVVSLMDEGIHGATIRSFGAKVLTLNQRKGGFSLSAFQRLRAILNEQSPDVVQTWMYHADLIGGIAAKSLGIPVVWGIRHSDNSLSSLGIKSWLVAKACATISGFVPSYIVACSQRAIDLHRKFGYSGRFIYIPNGFILSLKDFKDRGCNMPPVFGHAARFHPMKNHAGLLEAFSRLKKNNIRVQINFAGQGVSTDNPIFLNLIPKNIGSDVIACGPRHDMEDFYSELDCFLMSSAWGEAFPNVVAEAMLSGVPCIVTDVGDAAEIVGDTGWVVPPGNVDALAEAIASATEAAKDSDSWADRKIRARERIVAEYSMDKMKIRFEAVWKTAMEN